VTGADRPRGVQFIEMGISFLGAGFVITRCDLTTVFGGQLNLGDLVMLLNVTIWAIYSLLLRRRPADLPQDVTLAGSMLAGLVLLLPFVLASGPVEWSALTAPGAVLGIGYMALFASVLAFMFWSLGVTRLGSARSGQFINLMPVFGVILASLVLREIRRPAEMIGAATRLDRDRQRRVGTSIELMAFSVV
jgi:drug/metabolite transporter (DMT)-like permease